MILEIPTQGGVRIAQVVNRRENQQILAIFEGVFPERPEDLQALLATPATFGIADLPPNLFAKNCRIIGRGSVCHTPWFWHDMPNDEGVVWNARNSWRAINRADIDMSKVSERKTEALAELIARS